MSETIETVEVLVPVKFNGMVTVTVPTKDLEPWQCRRLAEQIALSRVIASLDNPDAPDLAAFEDLQEDLNGSCAIAEEVLEAAWDGCLVTDVGGYWSEDDKYNETFEAELQVDTEESIASMIQSRIASELEEYMGVSDECCQSLGRDILLEVLKQYRKDLLE